ncbi:MAG: hypothetical protein JSV43_04805 [Methanobacteriota archaeon]|nr:MAG: hypothetical protein JSV43_04805 [Euryarchaeota archaeon]
MGVVAWIYVGFTEIGLTIPLTVGALISVPFSALTVKRLRARNLRVIVGIAILAIGVIILLQAILTA